MNFSVWQALRSQSHRLTKTGLNVFVVVRYCGYDKDDYLFAYMERRDAEDHCSQLNGKPYDADYPDDFRVFSIPLVGL